MDSYFGSSDRPERGASDKMERFAHARPKVTGVRRLGLLCLGVAITAASEGWGQLPQSFDGFFRGNLECAPTSNQARRVRTQSLILVRDGSIMLSITRDDPTLIATGKADENGAFRAAGTAYMPGGTLQMNYTGTLSVTGGTLTGTQIWTRRDGEIETRTCEGAFTPTDASPRKQP